VSGFPVFSLLAWLEYATINATFDARGCSRRTLELDGNPLVALDFDITGESALADTIDNHVDPSNPTKCILSKSIRDHLSLADDALSCKWSVERCTPPPTPTGCSLVGMGTICSLSTEDGTCLLQSEYCQLFFPGACGTECCIGYPSCSRRRLLADLSTCCVFTGSYVGTTSPLPRDRFPALLKPSELLRLRELN
jgi:hypothetical protein